MPVYRLSRVTTVFVISSGLRWCKTIRMLRRKSNRWRRYDRSPVWHCSCFQLPVNSWLSNDISWCIGKLTWLTTTEVHLGRMTQYVTSARKQRVWKWMEKREQVWRRGRACISIITYVNSTLLRVIRSFNVRSSWHCGCHCFRPHLLHMHFLSRQSPWWIRKCN